ncbi:NAD(P)H-hydrate dehydratase [candidate division KSB1 bacterium RBG_16_48_16]|nr:MAG: NAD(P)H-hydrate dehydratase [candidate division KSB1 bacterium RBG_16_48_16]
MGTGVKGALKGIIAEAVRFINEQSAPILAVDIPTGVDADTGSIDGPAVRACRTATMALLKRGLLLSPGREYAGIVDIVDISMPESVASLKDPKTYLVERRDIAGKLPKRSADAYKNQCGTAGVLAGSTGYTGAAALTAEAVLRAGAGLCYLMAPEKLNVIYETKLTEVITVPFNDFNSGAFHSANFSDMLPKLREQDAVAIGPGIGQSEKTADLVHALLSELDKPMVLDADGLNVCAERLDLVKNYKSDLIITPHPGELARLAGVQVSNILADRIEFARRFAMDIGKIVVLKGGPSLIAMPDGRLYLNSTGNAGMATAGAGDVLTGLIAGLLAQGCPAPDAALAGVFIHGLAGDLAAEGLGQHGLLAGDILKWTAKAIQSLLEE